jgi:hypothetical protein
MKLLKTHYNSDNKIIYITVFGHVQRMEKNWIPKTVLYTNLKTKRLRGRSKNRWQNEMREGGRIEGGEGWQEKL